MQRCKWCHHSLSLSLPLVFAYFGRLACSFPSNPNNLYSLGMGRCWNQAYVVSMQQPQRRRASSSSWSSLMASCGWHAHCSDQPLGRGWCYVSPGRLSGTTIGSPTGNKSCGQAALQRKVPTPSVYDGDSPEESTHHLCSKFLLLWIKGTMRVSIWSHSHTSLHNHTRASSPGVSSGIQRNSGQKSSSLAEADREASPVAISAVGIMSGSSQHYLSFSFRNIWHTFPCWELIALFSNLELSLLWCFSNCSDLFV